MSTCRCDDGRPCCLHSKCANCDGSFVCKYGSSSNLINHKATVERDRAAVFAFGVRPSKVERDLDLDRRILERLRKFSIPTCEVCGKPVRDGLRFCSGMSECLKKGIGIVGVDEKAVDIINSPPHYTMGGIEVIDAIEAWGLDRNFLLANVIKYVARAGRKGDAIVCLKKAAWYLSRAIANLEKKAAP